MVLVEVGGLGREGFHLQPAPAYPHEVLGGRSGEVGGRKGGGGGGLNPVDDFFEKKRASVKRSE